MTDQPDNVPPFSNVSEYIRWTERNCLRCALSSEDTDRTIDEYTCDIEAAITLACITGEVPAAIYRRMGGDSGRCTERTSVLPPDVPPRQPDLPGQGMLFGGEQ